MDSNRTPSFRKIILPWYCSTLFYGIVLVFSAVIVIFGVTGVFVAKNQPEYEPLYLFPLILSLLGGALFLVNLKRLLSRFVKRRTGDRD
jgi:ABC-type sulfate transport system permease component